MLEPKQLPDSQWQFKQAEANSGTSCTMLMLLVYHRPLTLLRAQFTLDVPRWVSYGLVMVLVRLRKISPPTRPHNLCLLSQQDIPKQTSWYFCLVEMQSSSRNTWQRTLLQGKSHLHMMSKHVRRLNRSRSRDFCWMPDLREPTTEIGNPKNYRFASNVSEHLACFSI